MIVLSIPVFLLSLAASAWFGFFSSAQSCQAASAETVICHHTLNMVWR